MVEPVTTSPQQHCGGDLNQGNQLVKAGFLTWARPHNCYIQRSNNIREHMAQRIRSLFTITCCTNCGTSRSGRKNFQFYVMMTNTTVLYHFMLNKERKLWVKAASVESCLSICLSWSFVLTRCCDLIWVTKILTWAILNDHSAGFPHLAQGFDSTKISAAEFTGNIPEQTLSRLFMTR